jgi:cyclase
MLKPRITPCLLVHKGGLVKTVRFQEPKYVGDPMNAVKIFNEKEADELIVLDIDATAERREPDFKLAALLAVECRMPLCFGGGITHVAHAKRIVGLGIEKVAISSAGVESPELIAAIAREIGSQSVAVVLDVKKSANQVYEVWTHNAKVNTKQSPIEVAQRAESLGAGEIVINSIDNDGLMKGYDLVLAQAVRQAVNLPMTILGGAGSLQDMIELIKACGVIGAAAGSLFVFKGIYRAVLINYPNSSQKAAIVEQSLGNSAAPHAIKSRALN